MYNVYYNPEKFDLRPVAEIELDHESWQFNIVCVWQHTKTGEFYMGQDSGCSCPSPFEDYTSLDKLDRLVYDDLEKWVKSAVNQNEMADFLKKVRQAIGIQPMERRRLDGTFEKVW